MNHNVNANKMVSDTPRTDDAYFKTGATMYDLAGEMKRLERELNAANDRIKRLEEAGNQLKDRYILENKNWDLKTVIDWNEAKEDKL